MEPLFLLLFIPMLICSVMFHEIAHGLVALWYGDNTAKRAGRLTLNPIAHLDLFGSILLPGALMLFGSPVVLAWAKPVPINPLRFSNYRWGVFWVSAAGIITNFLIGLIAALAFRVFSVEFLAIIALLNFGLAFFNLLPIPPLDGLSLFAALCNATEKAEEVVARMGIFGFFILFMLLWSLQIGHFIFQLSYGLLALIAS